LETTEKLRLADLQPAEISARLGLPAFQGRQLFRWIHAKQVWDFEAMTDLPKALRQRLATECEPHGLELVEMQTCARTGTKKALLRLGDGETIECVLIRDRDRTTLCVSSQVGCALQCDFCATGLAGFTRNLTPGEIAAQALFLLKDEQLGERTPNIVYMGMGEPMRNYDNVASSIRLLMSPDGLGIGARKITVSTAGEIKRIEDLAREDWQVRLSVSLHAANNELRSRLVPLNRKYPLERLHETLRSYQAISGRQLTFEWTLLRDVNDQPQHARELIEYCRGLRVSVNLIPWNPVEDLPYDTSPRQQCITFAEILTKRGIKATLRQERGQDIDAACGQLRRTKGALA
jgi:23S rRNA (adenine2503-C2)-methyltransferase